ncbi:MAG: hypothetical protein K0U59_04785 [Gammaproteobacteria bacterium]|nr:hypothetical protein [Gammaproteobacteria bacterium]
MNKLSAIAILSTALVGAHSSANPSSMLANTPDPNNLDLNPVVPEYALTDTPYTTLQKSWAPIEPTQEVRSKMNDGVFTVYQHTQYADNGLGVMQVQGFPWIEHRELAPGFVQEGDQRRSLAYALVIPDPQIIDEESPIRLDGYDSVYRPHGQLTLQLFEAHVRTARRISDLSGRPFDFTVLPGDLTDSSQKNELEWMITILNGGVIDPDSGIDDDPVAGSGNDYNDSFSSVGTDWPWYPVLGNHDVLHVGGFGLIDEKLREAAVSDHLFTDSLLSIFWGGYVAGHTPDHQVILDAAVITPADPERLPLNKTELLQALHDADGQPAGHGFSQADVDSEKGYFSTYPLPNKPLKMIVLDTTDPTEANIVISYLGSMDRLQFNWLREELATAASLQELVIVVSHHRLEDFHGNSEVSPETIESLLVGSDNVILHLTGHGHASAKRILQLSGDKGKGYWELMSASTMDAPSQSRVLELVDERNGYLSIYATNVDHNSAEDTLAHKARQLAAGKLAFTVSGDDGDTVAEYWKADVTAQNLLLRVKLPEGVAANLAALDLPERIESVQTLNRF